MGRVRLSHIRRGKGLANSRSTELQGSLDVGERIKGFYVSRVDGTLQSKLLIFSSTPIQLNIEI